MRTTRIEKCNKHFLQGLVVGPQFHTTSPSSLVYARPRRTATACEN